MPQFKFVFSHPDLPKALEEAAADAPAVSKKAVEERVAAAEASGGLAFWGTVGAKDRETAKEFLLGQAHDRYHGIPGVSEGYRDRPDSLGIDPAELTLKLTEVSDG